MIKKILFFNDILWFFNILGVVVPRFDNIVDFCGLAATEIDVMVWFAYKFALNGGLEFISRQSQKINLILSGLYFVFSYFLDVLLDEISPISPIGGLLDFVIIERLYFYIVPFVNKPSSFRISSCCLLAGMFQFLYLLYWSEVVVYIQSLPNIALGLTSLCKFYYNLRNTSLFDGRILVFVVWRAFLIILVGFLLRLSAPLESITYAMRVSIIDQIIVIPDESIPPGCLLVTRWALKVASESLWGPLAREYLTILHTDHAAWLLGYLLK